MSSSSSSSSTKTVSGDWSAGTGLIPGQAVLSPLFLMATTPAFSMLFHHVLVQYQGNFVIWSTHVWHHDLTKQGLASGLFSWLRHTWPSAMDLETWCLLTAFLTFQVVLLKYVPGRAFVATLTPKGHRPTYVANGMACYLLTILMVLVLAYTNVWNPARVYDKYGTILSSLNVLALVFCVGLVIKGHVAPSTSDAGSTGNWIQDFYWGMELYPRIFGVDVKQFTNCRTGMMLWAVTIICFAYKNAQLHGGLQYRMAVSVGLQLVYITKFFHWEMGYMCSMDIQHDRAGYYICWGCLVWVPAVYTSAAFYLTTASSQDLSLPTAILIFTTGLLCIWSNYDADHQRYVFRQTAGQCRLWGRVPRKIVAVYTSTNITTRMTQTHESLLLVDGWWRLARHYHYVPEILASLCWALPAGRVPLGTAMAAYFYVVYLTILLTDRAFRDDDRCRKKYGVYWEQYCEQVPYRIVPGVV